MDDLLPIGSIVELKNNKRKMIIGYLPNKPNDKEFYDYICCNSKTGLRKEKKELKQNKDYFFINNEDIENVLFIGCQDKEFLMYKIMHNRIKEKLLEIRKNNSNLTEEDLDKLYTKELEDSRKEIEEKIGKRENKDE